MIYLIIRKYVIIINRNKTIISNKGYIFTKKYSIICYESE